MEVPWPGMVAVAGGWRPAVFNLVNECQCPSVIVSHERTDQRRDLRSRSKTYLIPRPAGKSSTKCVAMLSTRVAV